jgi:hypothetical protein
MQMKCNFETKMLKLSRLASMAGACLIQFQKVPISKPNQGLAIMTEVSILFLYVTSHLNTHVLS